MLRLLSIVALFVSLCSFAYAAPDPALNDRRIVAGDIRELDGIWTASSSTQNLRIRAQVPGDLITDLIDNKIIPEILVENNFLLNQSVWNDHDWIYSTSFDLSQKQLDMLKQGGDVWLVFDVVKMTSNVSINNAFVGQTINQFNRYNFSLAEFNAATGALKVGSNVLTVYFGASMINHGLFMQCTGGWDWAAYTQTVDKEGHQTFSRGIWKSVYLVDINWAAITDVTHVTRYDGEFPIKPLIDGRHAGFTLNTTVRIYVPSAFAATVTVQGSWNERGVTSSTKLKAGFNAVSLQMRAESHEVNLWWPVGSGDQPLYTVSVMVQGDSGEMLMDQRHIGFRFFAIVTGNDTDADYVKNHTSTTGTDTLGMMFRINGLPLFVRGANVIPMDELEGRYSAEAHKQMVLSARDGSMNILRIWGGGVYLPRIFYETADEVGILIYHDMMNRGFWGYSGVEDEDNGYRHQVRRLASHPSIVIWDGCNECNGTNGGIISVVMNTVASEDQTRPIWPSCPAPGWQSGTNRLSSLPDGKPMVEQDVSVHIEQHGPYQHGGGFPTVNAWDGSHADLFDPMTPLVYTTTPTGMTLPSVFTSEFGSIGYSSFESMVPTLSKEHWSLHGGSKPDNCSSTVCDGGNVIAQRNYPCDNLILTYWQGTQSDLDKVGEMPFKKQLYQCLIAQAFVLKGYIEQHRSTNTFGLQIWQLNEIWPTGGWGTLEYGFPDYPGQVVGGRWKPAHHWLRDNLFTDVIISCGVDQNDKNNLLCYVKNDAYPAHVVDIMVFAFSLENGASQTIYQQFGAVLASGPGVTTWFNVKGQQVDNTTHVFRAVVAENTGRVVAYNFFLLEAPMNLQLQQVTVAAKVSELVNADGSVDIMVSKAGQGALLFVTLTTLAHGRFSVNAFNMFEAQTIVQFIPFGPLDMELLRSSLRVESANDYQHV